MTLCKPLRKPFYEPLPEARRPAPSRYLSRLTLSLLLAGFAGGAGAEELLGREEREALDLSAYRVTDPDAGYFDVAERMAELESTDNAILLQELDEFSRGPSCEQLLAYEPITTRVRIPGYYPNPEEWELASEPLFRFEDSVSMLAGAFIASGDSYYADCLVRYLDHWAEAEALTDFHYDSTQPQAWFATESMLFAAGMAYATVRPFVEGLEEERERLEAWLNGLAHQHANIPGEPENSCCNNHFYRRALYGSIIGVITEDDELFRFGVSAIHSALHDMTEEGALPLEVNRGRRATHYQNYALLYLVTNMQVIARQGYEEIFDLEVDGNTLHDGVDFLFRILEDPAALGDFAPLEQYTGFLKDPQYFTWMEIYQARFDDSRVADFVHRVRPLYNRSAGGYMTLYLMPPDAQTHIFQDDEQRQTEAFRGLGES
ncbi:MAG: alginate lyase family protein [Halomonas sp.]|uniref:alginate lyase family protein n=1 Tax=Halomonas sp. TaxID=1486246 RepID=UPI0019FEE133|nr:alginate lyase family protein [Halomonas sp.]MBE0488182.1 alginate lyase family protein [Halomonas sp.]